VDKEIFFAILAVILTGVSIVAYLMTQHEMIAGLILLGAGVTLLRSIAPGLFVDN